MSEVEMRDSLPTVAVLTGWLRRSGTLPCGVVTDLRVELEFKTTISKLVFVSATYSSDAPSTLPRQLVVKSPLSQCKDDGDPRSEFNFYRLLAPVIGTPPLVRCLAAIDDGNENVGTLVLEDLRATHDHPPWPIPPSKSHCELAMDALAHVHSQWWESPALGNSVGQLHTKESLTSMVQGITKHLPAFIDAFRDALPSDGLRVYERVFSSSLQPWMRLTDPRALTIVHGDAHTLNFLFPRDGTGSAFLIDWQLWHVDIGARDLAYLMALHWHPSRRREVELPLIRYYYDALLARGLSNYSFEELWLDYRRCVVRNLTMPIILWSRGLKSDIWWHRLECALAAYHDLGCEELL